MTVINKNIAFDYAALSDAIAKISAELPFAEIFSLGKSCLNSDLFCIKAGCGNRKIFLSGAHHGTEWITAMLLTEFSAEILNAYKNKSEISGVNIFELLKDVSFYICPMVNPDGVGLAINGITEDIPEKYKKNLLKMNPSGIFIGKWQANIRGVDLNHNYNAGFFDGKKAEKSLGILSPCHSRYSGEKPESEPEVKAIVKFTKMLMPDLIIAYHSQGEQVFYDYMGKASENAKKIGEKIASLLGYKLDTPSGMASYSGYKDWAIDALSAYAYTIEVGKGKNPLNLEDFDKIYALNKKMLVRLFTDCLQFIY